MTARWLLAGLAFSACAGEAPEATQGGSGGGRTDAAADTDGSRPDLGPAGCDDRDSDGFTTCDGDCDDSSPWIRPAAREICDGLDNDCDGQTDETWPELGAPCGDGIGACAAQGRVICGADALSVTCDARPATPAEETCDGADEDCDGSVDEGAPGCCQAGESRVCGLSEGECRQGRMTCGEDQTFGPCEGGRAPAEHELCNGRDDDCDGRTDEDVSTEPDCSTGEPGVCGPGRATCDAGAEVCVPLAMPTPERCNNTDDDCDGETDEGLRNAAGECCAEAEELCNGVDDDCDGRVDEGTATAERLCVTPRGLYEGHLENGLLGHALHVVPDQDADGFADLLVGAPGRYTPDFVPGAVHLVSGRNGHLIGQWGGVPEDGELGYSLATADFDLDGQDEWIVGVPGARSDNNRHGRVYVLRAGDFRVLRELNGNSPSGRFGHAVAAGRTFSNGPSLLIVGQPVYSNSAGRLAVYDVGTAGAEPGLLASDLRWDAIGARGQENLGAQVALGPPDPLDNREIFAVHADDGSPRDTEILRFDEADGAPGNVVLATPDAPSQQTFGLSMSADDTLPLMVVGAWGYQSAGSARGAAWLLWPNGDVEDEVVGAAADAHLGFATALGPGLRTDTNVTWCAGAVTSALSPPEAQGRAGYTVCRTEHGESVLSVAGDRSGDAFGWAVALSPTLDPDGGHLLAVGAPRDDRVATGAGVVHLFRVVPE